MATVVPAPAGTSNIAQNFALAGSQLGQGIGQFLTRRRQQQQQLQQQQQQQQQQQALRQFLQQQGIQTPQGLPPEFLQSFALQQQKQRGAQALQAAKPTTPKQTSSVITDPNDPNKAIRVRNTFDENGNLVNQQFIGEATLAEKIGGVAAEGLQKGTQTKIEKDVIDLQATLQELGAIEKQFNPGFFTFRGKGRAFFTALGEKLEIPTGKAATTFLKERSKFFADSKRVFLKFRKFITGVAGGIEEFKEIAKATIDPEGDSPTEFLAKFESMRDNAIRTSNLMLAIQNSGLKPTKTNIKNALSLTPLSDIPLEIAPDVTLQTLGSQQINIPSQPQRQQLQPLSQTEESRRQELLRKAGQ